MAERPLATGEPAMRANGGRWLTTDGARVEDNGDGVWRFHVEKFPPEPVRPVMVELPLPAGIALGDEDVFIFKYRRAPAAPGVTEKRLRPDDPDPRMRPVSGEFGDMMEVYFRMENGNLYSSPFRLMPRPDWRSYILPQKAFTLAFWGRAQAPWRFAENRPRSIVFFLRPTSLPAVFEISYAEIGQWRK